MEKDKNWIIIPAYNEEKRIEKTLESYESYFEGKIEYEILVVINNTQDQTEEIVKKFSKKNKRIRYIKFEQGGKGFAVIEGFKESLKGKSELIGFVDADMATSPIEFHKLIRNIGNADCIIASRYVKGAKINPNPSFQRLVAKRAFNVFVRFLLLMPFKDTQCGAKVFKRKAVEAIVKNVTMSQWAFDVDLLFNLRKGEFKIKEFPTIWTDKEYSKINFWKAGPRMVLGVVRLRLINSPFKKLINLYDSVISHG